MVCNFDEIQNLHQSQSLSQATLVQFSSNAEYMTFETVPCQNRNPSAGVNGRGKAVNGQRDAASVTSASLPRLRAVILLDESGAGVTTVSIDVLHLDFHFRQYNRVIIIHKRLFLGPPVFFPGFCCLPCTCGAICTLTCRWVACQAFIPATPLLCLPSLVYSQLSTVRVQASRASAHVCL